MQQKADKKPHAHPARTGRRGRNLPAALCGFVGRLVLVLVILACLPVPAAHLFGYQMYNVISGSMEPAIPVGSAVYVKPAPPQQLQPGDVIAFYSGSSVVTHRVLENNPLQSSLITKGDANAQPDLEPVRYPDVIGRVEHHVPVLGGLLGVWTGGAGRSYLIALAVGGALLSLAGGLLGGTGKRAADGAASGTGTAPSVGSEENGTGTVPAQQQSEATRGLPRSVGSACEPVIRPAGERPANDSGTVPSAPADDPSPAAGASAAAEQAFLRRRRLRHAIMLLLALVLLFSLGGIFMVRQRAARQRQLHADEARQYTSAPAQAVQDPNAPPITVDFETLCALNGDVAGWIYCEGTGINYPVLHGATNDSYLRRDTEKNYSNAGSIFIEAQNRPGFADSNTVIYGHNMGDGSMFAPLAQWQQQAFFDEHPVMWLLTPQQNYKVLLFSAYMTDATSDTYTIFTGPCEEMDDYLRMAAAQSAVQGNVAPDGSARYILLSTCGTAYGSDTSRHVLHGMLQPVE